MAAYKLFGIPNCDTVKKARDFLATAQVTTEFIDFKKTPPKKSDILRWKTFMGKLPVNEKGQTYKKHKDEFEALGPDEKLNFLISQSSMIKRPVLEKDGEVVAFGFDIELYKSLLK